MAIVNVDSQDADSQGVNLQDADSKVGDSQVIDSQEKSHLPNVAGVYPGSGAKRLLDLIWQRRWQIIMLGCLLGAVHLRVENTSLRAALGDAQAQLRLADSLSTAFTASVDAEAENAAARTKRCMLEATHLRAEHASCQAEMHDMQAALADARAQSMAFDAALDDARGKLRLTDAVRKAAKAAAEAEARDAAARAAAGIRWGSLEQVDKRAEWRARLWEIPSGYDWTRACERTPLEGRKIVGGLPNWCEVTMMGVWGHWVVGAK